MNGINNANKTQAKKLLINCCIALKNKLELSPLGIYKYIGLFAASQAFIQNINCSIPTCGSMRIKETGELHKQSIKVFSSLKT